MVKNAIIKKTSKKASQWSSVAAFAWVLKKYIGWKQKRKVETGKEWKTKNDRKKKEKFGG